MNSLYDPLLNNLCGLSTPKGVMPNDLWPGSCKDFDGNLAEQDVIALGKWLLALQTFNLQQCPSKIRDVWRDRRNPTQWYTL